MNPLLKRLLGVIFAEQKGEQVSLFGVKADRLRADIMRTWSTSRIETQMFSSISAGRMTFPAFFAPDIHYVLQTIVSNPDKWGVRSTRRHLKAAMVALQEETWLKQVSQDFPSKLDHSKISLFHKSPLPHQTEFFNIYDQFTQRYNLRGYLLSARAGSGKTLTNLMLAEMRHSQYVVMVVPKNSVYRVWTKALQEEYKTPQEYWCAADGDEYKGQRFIVVHYEALDKLLKISSRLNGAVTVILDESHNLNDYQSQRSQAFVNFCHKVKAEDVIFSSGTPVKAMGAEVIPLLRCIDPLFTADVEQRFRKIFGKEAKRALDILRNRMGMLSYRVEQIAQLSKEPHKITHKIQIPGGENFTLAAIRKEMEKFVEERLAYYRKNMRQTENRYEELIDLHEQTIKDAVDKKDFERYRAAIKVIRKGYKPQEHKELAAFCNNYELKSIIPSLPTKVERDDFKDIRSIIKYVELKVMGEALGGVLGRKRAEVHRLMVPAAKLEQFVEAAETKTLIFTSFVSVVKELDSYFRRVNYSPIMVYGETNSQLDTMLTQFEKNEKLNPAVATYMSLSTAVPMTMASTAIFFNQPFREHELVQARARINRLGQQSEVTFVTVLLDTGDEPNVSTRANEILEWSKQQIAAIMGDEESAGAELALESDFNQFEDIEEYYTPARHPFVEAFESIESTLLHDDAQAGQESVYQEGADSTFGSQGAVYSLDKLFRVADKLPTHQRRVDQYDWILDEVGAIDPERVERSDLSFPILVVPTRVGNTSKWVVVDGLHRLQKAKLRERRFILVKELTEQQLESARITTSQ